MNIATLDTTFVPASMGPHEDIVEVLIGHLGDAGCSVGPPPSVLRAEDESPVFLEVATLSAQKNWVTFISIFPGQVAV